MEETDKAEFEIQIRINDATDEELDRFTRQLLAELRDLDVESVELTRSGSAPVGSKGDPITVGSIMISALPTVLPMVLEMVQTWVARGHGRMVKFEGTIQGHSIKFEGSPEDLQRLLETLPSKGKKKR